MFILFFCRLCNSCLSCILRACVLVLYIFTNVSQAYLGDISSQICTIMESDTLTKSQYKTFYSFLMPNFIGLNLLFCGVFKDKRFFFITSYELPIAFPHEKFIILNFHNWKLFLFNFSIAIWERPSAISRGNT